MVLVLERNVEEEQRETKEFSGLVAIARKMFGEEKVVVVPPQYADQKFPGFVVAEGKKADIIVHWSGVNVYNPTYEHQALQLAEEFERIAHREVALYKDYQP